MLRDIAKGLTPPTDEAALEGWRWKMFITVLGLAAVLAFHMAATSGRIPGITGVANAADLKQLDVKIEAVQKELKSEIADVKTDVADVAASQNTLLRLAIAADICRIQWLRMDADGLLLRTLNASFDRQQEAYAAVNAGVRYGVIQCGPQR